MNILSNLSSAEFSIFVGLISVLLLCIVYILLYHVPRFISWLRMTPSERFIKSYNDSIDKDKKDKWR